MATTRKLPACQECQWSNEKECRNEHATGVKIFPRATRNCSGYKHQPKTTRGILIMRKPNLVTAHVVKFDVASKVLLSSHPLDHIIRHSPDGFEYGYGGSGPADLALSICTEIWGLPKAEKVYQHFAKEVIGVLDQKKKRHLLLGSDIVAWVKTLYERGLLS